MTVEDSITKKIIKLIDEGEEIDKDFLFEIYRSELDYKAQIMALNTSIEIEKIKAQTNREISLIEMGYIVESDTEE